MAVVMCSFRRRQRSVLLLIRVGIHFFEIESRVSIYRYEARINRKRIYVYICIYRLRLTNNDP